MAFTGLPLNNKPNQDMRLKANAFPIINSIPNLANRQSTEEWDSLGDAMKSYIPMNEHGQFHGILQTFSNGKLLEEKQYHENKIFGCSVFYGAHGSPLSVRVVSKIGLVAKFR